MNMQENYRLIEALESAGWTAQEIVNLIKYIESGDERKICLSSGLRRWNRSNSSLCVCCSMKNLLDFPPGHMV